MLRNRIALLLVLVTAMVLVSLVAWLTWMVRGQLRTAFIDQHGEILQPLAESQLRETRENLLLTGDLIGASDFLSLALTDVNVDELVDVRLFDTDGFLISEDFMAALSVALHPADRLRGLEGAPSSRYHPEATLEALFPEAEAVGSLGVPLVEVVVPLRDDEDRETLAMVRYLLNGEGTAEDLRGVDRQLITMSGSLLVVAMMVLGGLFAWGFGQLERSRVAMEKANERLVELNHQLAFVDKSSAIGTLTAHLVHGLRNPLASLRGMFEGPVDEEGRGHGKERVQEMQRMIDQLVDVIRDEESELVYEYQLEEVREMLVEKTRVEADRSGVELAIGEVTRDATLTGREGNVTLLILVNLIDNALQASPPGARVEVDFKAPSDGKGWSIEVRDQGKGIPEEWRERLFLPKRSHKDRGAGIGLVISAQLARQIGGELTLLATGPEGTCFQLALKASAA